MDLQEAKVETKQQVKRLNLKTACTPLSSHKPNPKLICGKKVLAKLESLQSLKKMIFNNHAHQWLLR